MTIDFMDAIKGKKTDITYTRSEVCPTCDGSGAEKELTQLPVTSVTELVS